MKKFVMGLVLGVGLTVAFSAAAEEIQSLIGKQVEGQVAVVVDGVQISVPAAIIDGTSYAPVRAVGEAVDREVDWKEGKVLLNEKTVSVSSLVPQSTPDVQQELINKRSVIDYNIGILQAEIHSKYSILKDKPEKVDNVEQWKKDIADLEAKLKEWQDKRSELEKVLPN